MLAAAVLAGGFVVPTAQAEDWVDTQGESFSGDPAGLVGPLALFKPGRKRGKRLPLANLRPEDAYRFDLGLRKLPERAEKWSEGKSVVSRELLGNVQRVVDGRLQDTDLSEQAEPELVLFIFADIGTGAREIIRAADPHYRALKEKFGDDFEAVFVGVRHTLSDQISLAESLNMPWLVMKRNRQSQLDEIADFAPYPDPGYALLNRHAVPITTQSGIITSDIDKIFAQTEGLIVSMVPNNPRTWVTKVEYYKNVRQKEFANGEADPMLVGPPLLSAVLDRIGVTAFELDAEIDATGKATNVVVHPGPGIPDKYLGAVAKSFAAAPFVPAVKNGEFVPGTLHYSYQKADAE